MSQFLYSVLDRALAGAETLPLPERADLYDGIAILFAPHNEPVANHAREAAAALRRAESSQLLFAQLLRVSSSPIGEEGAHRDFTPSGKVVRFEF